MESDGHLFGWQMVAVCGGLLIFGIFYNWLIEQFQKKTVKYTAELVVIGVLVTITASGFVIGWGDAFVLTIIFAASGTPMLVGSWLRTMRDEEQARLEWNRKFLDELREEMHK